MVRVNDCSFVGFLYEADLVALHIVFAMIKRHRVGITGGINGAMQNNL